MSVPQISDRPLLPLNRQLIHFVEAIILPNRYIHQLFFESRDFQLWLLTLPRYSHFFHQLIAKVHIMISQRTYVDKSEDTLIRRGSTFCRMDSVPKDAFLAFLCFGNA